MSNTFHHDEHRYHPWLNPRCDAKRLLDYELRQRRMWDYFSRGFHYCDYAAAGPHWWRNMQMERPMRRLTKRLLRDVLRSGEFDRVWPVPRKPTMYWW